MGLGRFEELSATDRLWIAGQHIAQCRLPSSCRGEQGQDEGA
jgi:hypothetical protein